MTFRLAFMRLPHGDGLPTPSYATDASAGLDLSAAVGNSSPITLNCGKYALIPTALVVELPPGFEAQIRPRSGLAARHGVTVLNAPGTIDSDYRGEIQVLLINHGPEPVAITRGMRIAQMVVAPVARVVPVEGPIVTVTARGTGGFGSTGL